MTTDHTLLPDLAGGRAATLPPIPADYDRLEPLYEIQAVLAQALDIEQACDALLPIVTRTLQIRTTVLLDLTPDLERTFLWATSGIATAVLEEARDHAWEVLVYLAGGASTPTKGVSRTAVLPGGVTGQGSGTGNFVTLPLVHHGDVFGVFQLEGALAFDEHDLLFINVVVSQLAVALDRHHIQRELETSRAEVERANRRLRELQGITESALEGATLDESLSGMLRGIRAMFAADVAAVLLASADGKALCANVPETASPVVITVEGELGFGHDAPHVCQEERGLLAARGDRLRGPGGDALGGSGESHLPRASEAQDVHG